MAWKFVSSINPKWPHWTLLLTDFYEALQHLQQLILKLLNLARISSCLIMLILLLLTARYIAMTI